MQPAQDRTAKNITDGPNGARYRLCVAEGEELGTNPLQASHRNPP